MASWLSRFWSLLRSDADPIDVPSMGFEAPTSLRTDEPPGDPERPQTNLQIGFTGSPLDGANSIKQDDYNPKMVGPSAVRIFETMRKSDASIRSVLQAVKLPLLRAKWRVAPKNEEQADELDLEIAQFCERTLLESKQTPWQQVLGHMLLMLDFGFSVLEKVWDTDEEGRLYVRKLAPRLPQTITEFQVDDSGELLTVVQRAQNARGQEQDFKIPALYAVVLSYEKEGANFWGVSLLRFLYQHWFYKTELYRIDAVRLDRFGVGIPRAKIKEGYALKQSEKKELENILSGLRSHQRAYIITPEEIDVSIMTPENEAGGASGLMEAIDHHDIMISRAVLANFLTAGVQKHGNYGTTVTWADLFLFGLQGLALEIADQLDRQVIRELCDLNYDMTGREYPRLVASSLEDVNFKETAAALYNLVLGQVLTPDDKLEAHIRNLYGLPVLQEGFSRVERGVYGPMAVNPALAAPNITGEPSRDDKEAMREPTPGTKPGTTPPSGPIRVPGELR